MTGWQPMDTAPKDRPILVRRHNDVMYEYYIVEWCPVGDRYPWRDDYNAYPTERLDNWHEIPQ